MERTEQQNVDGSYKNGDPGNLKDIENDLRHKNRNQETFLFLGEKICRPKYRIIWKIIGLTDIKSIFITGTMKTLANLIAAMLKNLTFDKNRQNWSFLPQCE